MRRRMIATSCLAGSAMLIGLIVFIAPHTPAGRFPSGFSLAERRQIASAGKAQTRKFIIHEIRKGEFRIAGRWIANARRLSVRDIRVWGNGTIWVDMGVDNPAAAEGYDSWLRYAMKKDDGRWVNNAQ